MRKIILTLNCDMGEGLDAIDAQIMPYIGSVNIACGGHAGDETSMLRTVQLATQHHVEIGAHPSFVDKEGFGRREMSCSQEKIETLIHNQCAALQKICTQCQTQISYVKPHGALYNMMMKEMTLFKSICHALSTYDASLKLMILSSSKNQHFAKIAKSYGITLLYEVFADRGYSDDGSLISRSEPNAILNNIKELLQRAKSLQEEGYIESLTGQKLYLEAHTLCIHSDTGNALELIQNLAVFLDEM